MNKILRVKCPHCEHIFCYYDSEFRPFCSEKCKMIDLGHWFEESYRVPGKEKLPATDSLNGSNQNEEEEFDYEEENFERTYDEDESDSEYES